EDVVGRDRRRIGIDGIGDFERTAVALARHDEAERRGCTGPAVELEEDQIVAAGQEPDAGGRDGLIADGASETVHERAEIVLTIHPGGVYPVGPEGDAGPAACERYPPGV